VVTRGDAVEVGWMQRLGCAAENLTPPRAKKVASDWFISSVHLLTTATVSMPKSDAARTTESTVEVAGIPV